MEETAPRYKETTNINDTDPVNFVVGYIMEPKTVEGGANTPSANRAKTVPKKRKSLHERAFEKVDTKKDLRRLEDLLQDLKVEYEQYFLGLTPFQPEKLHKEVRRLIRRVRKAPFKKPAIRFRQLMLEQRYQTYNDYWQRVLRQKEEGTYVKDLFKAQLKERLEQEEKERHTAQGAAKEGLQTLFATYKRALERETGCKQAVDFEAFKKALIKQAQAHKERFGPGKLSFKVVIKEGRVLIKARAQAGCSGSDQ
jgi:hypothetical protein